jgi:hypothetical protein
MDGEPAFINSVRCYLTRRQKFHSPALSNIHVKSVRNSYNKLITDITIICSFYRPTQSPYCVYTGYYLLYRKNPLIIGENLGLYYTGGDYYLLGLLAVGRYWASSIPPLQLKFVICMSRTAVWPRQSQYLLSLAPLPKLYLSC